MVLITGEEKLFFQFELNRKKRGEEKMFFSSPKSYFEKSPINIYTGEHKNKYVNKKEVNTDEMETIEFQIEDDYGEKLSTGFPKARIGTTLANFLNKIGKIYPKIQKYIEIVESFDESQMKNLRKNKKLNLLTDKYKKYIEIQEALDSASLEEYRHLLKEHNIPSEDCIEQNFKKEEEFQYLMKKYNLDYDDIMLILNNVVNKCFDAAEEYQHFILKKMFLLEEELINICGKNKALRTFISYIFSNFNYDYEFYISHLNKLNDFITMIEIKNEKNSYNKYYYNLRNAFYQSDKNLKNILINNFKDDKAHTKIEIKNFSEKTIATIFLNSLFEELKLILDDIYFIPEKLEKVDIISSGIYQYSISSFYELFYVSKFFIYKDGNAFDKCNLCGKFFITQVRKTEKNCRRLYKKTNMTCSECVKFNSGKGNTIVALISREKKAIRSLLVARDLHNRTNRLQEFNTKELPFLDKLDKDEELKKLKDLHLSIKNENKK